MTFGASKPRVGGDTSGFAPKIKYETPHHHEKNLWVTLQRYGCLQKICTIS